MSAPRRAGKKPRGTAPARRKVDPPAASFDLVRDVLDHELLDRDGVPCGMVDDIVLDGAPGQPLRIAALMVGPGGWLPRLPAWIGGIARRVVGAGHVRVPWNAIAHVGERIRLNATAVELGLGKADRRLGRLVVRVPGARRAPE